MNPTELVERYNRGERGFRGAKLVGAYLSGAYLRGVNLRGADLSGADLSGANLSGAYLREADLSGADLSGADLRWLDLRWATLRGAYLEGVYLRGADLSGANLRGVNLRGANLRGADLSEADLSEANLREANLVSIRGDLYGYLEHVPHEVASLLATLEAGEIDGSSYDGACACLAGTCERIHGAAPAGAGETLEALRDLREASSPRERWFLAIRPGDTPANSPVAAITAEWLRAWLAAHAEVAQQRKAGGDA